MSGPYCFDDEIHPPIRCTLRRSRIEFEMGNRLSHQHQAKSNEAN